MYVDLHIKSGKDLNRQNHICPKYILNGFYLREIKTFSLLCTFNCEISFQRDENRSLLEPIKGTNEGHRKEAVLRINNLNTDIAPAKLNLHCCQLLTFSL